MFKVKNTGTEVTEFYLYAEDGLRIVGEIENVGPGLTRDLVVRAAPGTYVTACKPGHGRQGHPLDVHRHRLRQEHQDQGRRPGHHRRRHQPVRRLRPGPVAAAASTRPPSSSTAYKAGDDDEARTLFPHARQYWERIETVAESFGDLDPKMDLREADLEQGQKWTGWHRIEKDLWPPASGYKALTPAERATYADDLLANTKILDKRVQDLKYTVDQIGNGSKGLLDEVATGKITGEEDIWSHTDLYDFQANVDGARVGYEGLKPLLEVKDPALVEADRDRVRRAADAARQVQAGRGRLRLLRQGHRGPAQGALRRGQRPRRAAVQDDRSHHPVTEHHRSTVTGASPAGGSSEPPARARSPVGAAGVGGFAYGHETDERRRAPAVDQATYPFHGRAPGRHHHPGPGPAALRRLRRHHRLPRRAGRPAARPGPRPPREMTAGTPVGGGAPTPYDAPPTDTGEALGPDRLRADPDLRLRADAVREGRQGPVRPQGPAARRRCASCRTSRPTTSTRRAATATSASRPAPTTRRSPCTRSATWPGSASAPSRCAGPSSASAGPPRPRPSRPRARNLLGFKDGTANLKSEDPDDVEKFVWVARGRRRRRRPGWPAAPTSSPGGSTCTSSPGTAPACASRRR